MNNYHNKEITYRLTVMVSPLSGTVNNLWGETGGRIHLWDKTCIKENQYAYIYKFCIGNCCAKH